MQITEFEKSRDLLTNQYKNIDFSDSGGMDCDMLYSEFKKIYSSEKSKQYGKGKALEFFFKNAKIHINYADIFADMIDVTHSPLDLRQEEYDRYKKHDPLIEDMISEGAFFANEDFGHTMPDYRTVLKYGFKGIYERAKKLSENSSLSQEQKNFYLSVKHAYSGIIEFVKRLSQKACENDSKNAAFMAKNLKTLTGNPPQTLGEAMQTMFIFYAAQHTVEGENIRSLGGLDDLLYPYFRRDLDNGILSEEEIREIVKYFLYKWNSMSVTANMPFYLCGRKDGAESTNGLTYIILEEYTKMNIYDPKIHIKYSAETPKRVAELVMNSIRNGNNSFVFVNDDVIPKALAHIGIEPRDAENYTLIGCYEPSAIGAELPCTCNGAINMPVAVEIVLNNGKNFNSDKIIGLETGDAGSFESFDEFFAAVKKQLAYLVKMAMKNINNIEKYYPEIIQSPIFSATYESCMEKGADLYSGGAKYNNSSICATGIGTVTDELIAIKKAVFEDKIISLSDLKEILESNWEKNPKMRKILRDSYPKYGNNNPEADELAVEICEFMAENINNKPNGRNGVYRLGLFSIDWRLQFGNMLGASADGRFKAEPISKNMCSSVGLDKNGVTAVINSVVKTDYTKVPDGTVLDLHIHPSAVKEEDGISLMQGILNVCMKKGGMAMQMNVMSAEELKKAQKFPDRYRNLQVRLCGWNVYFLDLSLKSQEDLIKSMESDVV